MNELEKGSSEHPQMAQPRVVVRGSGTPLAHEIIAGAASFDSRRAGCFGRN
jgi:hypothetical protein